jgi:hypothetical protein
MTPSAKPMRTRGNAKIHGRTSSLRNHSRIMEPIHSKLLLHQKERWKTASGVRLLSNQQMDEEESKHISANPADYR